MEKKTPKKEIKKEDKPEVKKTSSFYVVKGNLHHDGAKYSAGENLPKSELTEEQAKNLLNKGVIQ